MWGIKNVFITNLHILYKVINCYTTLFIVINIITDSIFMYLSITYQHHYQMTQYVTFSEFQTIYVNTTCIGVGTSTLT